MATTSTSTQEQQQVIIIGCGIFGLSTAYWMLKQNGKYRVTLLDQNPRVPAPDAASSGELASSFQCRVIRVG
jgi:glycine/D-amino acid oxidase-like deaminating enzyme